MGGTPLKNLSKTNKIIRKYIQKCSPVLVKEKQQKSFILSQPVCLMSAFPTFGVHQVIFIAHLRAKFQKDEDTKFLHFIANDWIIYLL